MRTRILASCLAAAAFACGGDDGPPDLFEPKPECAGEMITPFAGAHPQVISKLEIGAAQDGFDLDGDGLPDNKLQGVRGLANPGIAGALSDYSLLIPIEMFDFATAAADACVKFALYLGIYTKDGDGDGEDTSVAEGDCNDLDMAIRPGATEVAGNGKDDNCNGMADEGDTDARHSQDQDGDGASPATGDCDDTNAMVGGLTGGNRQAEICGDGLDNDCSGVADRGPGDPPTTCNPFDSTPDAITIDPLSFAGGAPVIKFDSGEVVSEAGKLMLKAGPSLFAVSVPITGDLVLTLKITGTQIEAEVVEVDGHLVLRNGRLGGVIDAVTADTLRGLEFEDIGLRPEDSLLDAIFANSLGVFLALPAQPDTSMFAGCRTPDIDVDRDGYEIFCDTNSDNNMETKVVDLCVDGDGTVIRDEVVGAVTKHCTEAVDGDGKPRFVDGISVELNFETAPATLLEQ